MTSLSFTILSWIFILASASSPLGQGHYRIGLAVSPMDPWLDLFSFEENSLTRSLRVHPCLHPRFYASRLYGLGLPQKGVVSPETLLQFRDQGCTAVHAKDKTGLPPNSFYQDEKDEFVAFS